MKSNVYLLGNDPHMAFKECQMEQDIQVCMQIVEAQYQHFLAFWSLFFIDNVHFVIGTYTITFPIILKVIYLKMSEAQQCHLQVIDQVSIQFAFTYPCKELNLALQAWTLYGHPKFVYGTKYKRKDEFQSDLDSKSSFIIHFYQNVKCMAFS